MTSKKTARRALFSSVMAMILCVAMLVSTTFAWFTDNATTGLNQIVSGKLDVALVDATGASLEGDTMNFVNKNDSNQILWEPGVTFVSEGFKVVNQGNLALKYKLTINGVDGDAKLLEAIDFWLTNNKDNVNGVKVNLNTEFSLNPEGKNLIAGVAHESDLYYLVGHMREDAGNEYQDLTLDGVGITVYATQEEAEFDSFDNEYDKDADYDSWQGGVAGAEELAAIYDPATKSFNVTTAAQLAGIAAVVNKGEAFKVQYESAAASAALTEEQLVEMTTETIPANFKGYTVKLGADIDLNGMAWTPIGHIDPNDHDGFGGTFDGQGNTIYNLSVSGDSNVAFFNYINSTAVIKNVTFDGAYVQGHHYVAVVVGWEGNETTGATIENVTVKNSTVIASADATPDNGDKVGGIAGYAVSLNIDNCVVDHTTIQGYRDVGGIIGYANANKAGSVAISGNLVKNVQLICDTSENYKKYVEADEYDINAICGEATANATFSNNTETNVTVTIPEGTIPGTTITLAKAAIPQEGGTLYLNSAADFWKLAELTNSATWLDVTNSNGNDHFHYQWAWKVVLNCDVDLESKPWTPVAIGEFGGFDGQGHTISNLYINSAENRVGLFSSTLNGDSGVCPISNFTIECATVTGGEVVGVAAAYAPTPISNVTVKDAAVNGAKYVGGIVGKAGADIINCTVIDSTINSTGKEVGGIVGFHAIEGAAAACTVENCYVENTTVTGTEEVGGIVGRAYPASGSTLAINGCSTKNVSVTATTDTTYYGEILGRDYNGTGVVIDGVALTAPIDEEAEFNSAVANAETGVKTELELAAGNYTLPSANNKDIAISGTKDTVITVGKPNYSGSDVSFEGVTIKGSGYSTGVQHVNAVTYTDATIVGEMCLYGEKVVFDGCTFELEKGQYIWTYGAKEVEFIGCTFNTAGKAILIYNEGAGASNVTVKNCVFKASAGDKAGAIANQNCAAIEIDNFQSSGTGAAHKLTTSGNSYGANFSGEWRIKNFVAGNAITVNGVGYNTIALDGKTMTIDADKNVTVND